MFKSADKLYIENYQGRCIFKEFYAELYNIDRFKNLVNHNLSEYGLEIEEFHILPYFDGLSWFLMFIATTSLPFEVTNTNHTENA